MVGIQSDSEATQTYEPSHLPPVGGGGSCGGVADGGEQKPTTLDALSYLMQVKRVFKDQREKYDMFLAIMKDFRAQRIDRSGAKVRVKELFKDNPDLIIGFNFFLPKGCEISLTGEDEFARAKRIFGFDEEGFCYAVPLRTVFRSDSNRK